MTRRSRSGLQAAAFIPHDTDPTHSICNQTEPVADRKMQATRKSTYMQLIFTNSLKSFEVQILYNKYSYRKKQQSREWIQKANS